MILTPEETEEAAQRLADTSEGADTWNKADENERKCFRLLVTELAAALDVPHTPAGVLAFMTWVGSKPTD